MPPAPTRAPTPAPRIRIRKTLIGDLWEASCEGCSETSRQASRYELGIWTARHGRDCRLLPRPARAEADRELTALRDRGDRDLMDELMHRT